MRTTQLVEISGFVALAASVASGLAAIWLHSEQWGGTALILIGAAFALGYVRLFRD